MKDSGDMHLVLCSHLLRDVEETCEEVLILKQGRIAHYSDLQKERSANKRFLEIETGARQYLASPRRFHGSAASAPPLAPDDCGWKSPPIFSCAKSTASPPSAISPSAGSTTSAIPWKTFS